MRQFDSQPSSPPNLSCFLVNKNKRAPNLEARHLTDVQNDPTQFVVTIFVSVDIPYGGVSRWVGIAFRVLSISPGQISITSILSQEAERVSTGLADAIVLFERRNEPARNRLFSALNS